MTRDIYNESLQRRPNLNDCSPCQAHWCIWCRDRPVTITVFAGRLIVPEMAINDNIVNDGMVQKPVRRPPAWYLIYIREPLSFLEATLTLVLLCLFRWCGPCKILGPRLEKAVAKQKGRVAMAKVDIDDHTDLAIEYGVSLSFVYRIEYSIDI